MELREIALTQGKVALVDACDFEDVAQYRWFAHRDQSTGRFYAARLITIAKKTQRYISMHRYLMNFPPLKVDHIDRDGLHNWRENLRAASNKQNSANSRIQANNTSGYRGVSFRKDKIARPWSAYIIDDQRQVHLGFWATAEDAALAHDAESFRRRGPYAALNFPERLACRMSAAAEPFLATT